MKYFKDPSGAVWGYDPADQSALIQTAQGAGWVDISGSWPPAAPPPSAPTTISTWDFLHRFTASEQLAIQSACSATPSVGLYLTKGLAAGMVDLTSPDVPLWLNALVAAGAITQARATAVQVP